MTGLVSSLKTEHQHYQFEVKTKETARKKRGWMVFMKDHSAADADDDWTQEFGT